MKKYYYTNGKEKLGAFSLEELKEENINPNTLIWFEGLDDWERVKDLEELKPILEFIPPTFMENNNPIPTPPKSMKKYYYINGKEKLGAFSLEELKRENINPNTLIWFEGLDNYTLAKDLEELKPILEKKEKVTETDGTVVFFGVISCLIFTLYTVIDGHLMRSYYNIFECLVVCLMVFLFSTIPPSIIAGIIKLFFKKNNFWNMWSTVCIILIILQFIIIANKH